VLYFAEKIPKVASTLSRAEFNLGMLIAQLSILEECQIVSSFFCVVCGWGRIFFIFRTKIIFSEMRAEHSQYCGKVGGLPEKIFVGALPEKRGNKAKNTEKKGKNPR